MLRSGEKKADQGGTSGPKGWHSDELTGFFCFGLHMSQTWSLSTWQPRNAMESKQKKPSKSLLSLARGPGKGQPRKARLLDDNFSTPAKHLKKQLSLHLSTRAPKDSGRTLDSPLPGCSQVPQPLHQGGLREAREGSGTSLPIKK